MLYPALIAIAAILISGLRIAQEYQRAIVFRLGRFQSVRGPGLYWLIPLIESQQKVDIRTQTVDLEQQETITKACNAPWPEKQKQFAKNALEL